MESKFKSVFPVLDALMEVNGIEVDDLARLCGLSPKAMKSRLSGKSELLTKDLQVIGHLFPLLLTFDVVLASRSLGSHIHPMLTATPFEVVYSKLHGGKNHE